MNLGDFFDVTGFWKQITDVFKSVKPNDFIDILLVSVILYYSFRLIRETRAMQILKGFGVFAFIYLVVDIFNLKTMHFILEVVLTVGLTALVVMFQPELRRALEQMGQVKIPFFGFSQGFHNKEAIMDTIDKLCISAESLSSSRTGALIVIERKTKLGDIAKTGTKIDADISTELIGNLFFVNSPLHDGAVIIRENRILAAGCFLPISSNMTISKELGTRHRAALGMSENSDAIILIISEETGHITIADNGFLKRKLTVTSLHKILENALIPLEENHKKKNSFWRRGSVEK